MRKAITSIRLAVAAFALSLDGAPSLSASPMEPGDLVPSKGEVLLLDQLRVRGEFPRDVLNELGPARTMRAVIDILNRHGLKFERGDVRIPTSLVPEELMAEINKLPPGEPFIVPAGDIMTANVIRERIPAE